MSLEQSSKITDLCGFSNGFICVHYLHCLI